jgi:Tol biopolymer transport system component
LDLPFGPVAQVTFSPDEALIGFTAPSLGDARHDLYVMEVGSSNARKLTAAGDVFFFVWCHDSESLIVSSSSDKRSNSRRRLWWVDVAGGGLASLPLDIEGNQWPSDCTAGREQVAFELRLDGSGMFVARRSGQGYEVESLGPGRGGRWSPDGSRLVFTDQRGDQTDVFVRESDGSVVQVTSDEAVETNVRWTPDGHSLVFDRVTPNRGIWILRF